MSLRRGVLTLSKRLESTGKSYDVVLQLTLLWLLVYAPGFPATLSGIRALCVIGVAEPRIRRAAAFWGITAAVVWWGVLSTWVVADNHKYLAGYWCLALFASSIGSEPRTRVIRTNANLLLGLAFAYATLWKTMSPDFLDGRFMESQLLVDSRMAWIPSTLAGLGPDLLAGNRIAFEQFLGESDPARQLSLATGPLVAPIAKVLTVVTYAMEAALAIVFLAWRSRFGRRARHPLMILFLLTTYLVAPIYEFGLLLGIISISATYTEEGAPRRIYFASVLLILIYSMVVTALR